MLVVTYGGAATLVYWLRRPVARRFVIPVATTGLWTLWAAWFYLMMPFGMWEEEAKSLVSPDGRYKAVLSYRDGMTFGYQHVLLERTALHRLLAPAEVTEADSEGLDQIAWRDSRTLVVRYSCPENELVVRNRQWWGVRIIYQRQ